MYQCNRFIAPCVLVILCLASFLISDAQPFIPNYTYSGATTIAPSPAMSSFNIIVPASVSITSIRVRVNITYPVDRDLTFRLNHWDLSIFNNLHVGGPFQPLGADFINTIFDDNAATPILSGTSPYTGSFIPSTTFTSVHVGTNSYGLWQLQIQNDGASAGTLNGFELEINGGGPLPVEMTSFSAVGGDNRVNLNWRTESETNNASFKLYRSLSNDVRGDVLSQILGHGTTATAHNYSYVDTRVQNGTTYYYRISDVDVNGVERVHPMVVSASPSARAMGVIPSKYELTQNFPNPFNPTTEFSYSLPEAGVVRLSVFNLLGQEVHRLVDEMQQPNVYRVRFDASKLPTGTYFYQLSTPNHSSIKRMVLMK